MNNNLLVRPWSWSIWAHFLACEKDCESEPHLDVMQSQLFDNIAYIITEDKISWAIKASPCIKFRAQPT